MPGSPPPESGSELFIRISTIPCSSGTFRPTAAFLWPSTRDASGGVFDVANAKTQGPRDRAAPSSTLRPSHHRCNRRLHPSPTAFTAGDQTAERCNGQSTHPPRRLPRCQHRQPEMGKPSEGVPNRRSCGPRRNAVKTRPLMFSGAKSLLSRSTIHRYSPPKGAGNERCCAS